MPRTADQTPAEQFVDLDQQAGVAELGMWVFIASEILLFGGLLLSYFVYRFGYPDGFAEAARHTRIVIGTTNTVLLLTSSFLVAWAIECIRNDLGKIASILLLIAILCGLGFIGLKGFEYWDEYNEALVPGLNFSFDGPFTVPVRLFFSFYFISTGLHALHMSVGLVALAVVAIKVRRGTYSSVYSAPASNCALYWHFVDVVWILLFALIYLPGRSS